MPGAGGRWVTKPPLLVPDGSPWWLTGHAGAAAVVGADDQGVELLVSGRDAENRSHLGQIWCDPDHEVPTRIAPDPVLAPGTRGGFDDAGVSYPCVVRDGSQRYLLYTGWSRRVSVPFQNDLGLAVEESPGRYRRVSRAPILPLDDGDHLSIGSSFALVEDGIWRLWYTSWTDWGEGEVPHRYEIKYATSPDGRTWHRDHRPCIAPIDSSEHSICRPSVVRLDDGYHMWFCARGEQYQIWYAWSADGVSWTRAKEPVQFSSSTPGFDDESRAYPVVFRHDDRLLMAYSGNGYGRAGLGLAELESLEQLGQEGSL